MRIVFARHGDPDYEHDSLTEKGVREAAFLSERLASAPADAYYCSPLGRARATAAPTMSRLGREAEVLPWLEEFRGRIVNSDGRRTIAWDLDPRYWTQYPCAYDRERWHELPIYDGTNVRAEYDTVCAGLDALIEKHGYIREGGLYRPVRRNRDTIVLFCHMAVTGVMLSHLLGTSPIVLWHGMFMPPASLTVAYTEERFGNAAVFRLHSVGDTSHFYANGEKPSHRGSFSEVYGE